MLVIKARIHKMLVRIANSTDPDQTASSSKQSDLGLYCLYKHFWQATSVLRGQLHFTGLCLKLFPTFYK